MLRWETFFSLDKAKQRFHLLSNFAYYTFLSWVDVSEIIMGDFWIFYCILMIGAI